MVLVFIDFMENVICLVKKIIYEVGVILILSKNCFVEFLDVIVKNLVLRKLIVFGNFILYILDNINNVLMLIYLDLFDNDLMELFN